MRIPRQIAAQMKARAQAKPDKVIRHTLGDGLRLVVCWKSIGSGQGGDWYLCIWRNDREPSDAGVRGRRKVFEVREDAGRSERMQKG